jgi:hypothetical protein
MKQDAQVAADATISGPAVKISDHPWIVLTASNPSQPIGLTEMLGRACPERKIVFLVSIFWSCDDGEIAVKVAAKEQYCARFPLHEVIFLGNTPEEVRRLQMAGADAFFANHNMFASQQVFAPLLGEQVVFDAVYVTRPSRGKRHKLAAENWSCPLRAQ